MAVKKNELDNRNQLDLMALVQYIHILTEQHNFLPQSQELIKICQDTVKCLARTSGNEEELWVMLQTVEDFLIRVINEAHPELRHEIVTAILDKFYSFISDPQSDAGPATSIVLIVLDWSDTEAPLAAARWLVQQFDNGPAGAGLRASLSCLYRWIHEWRSTAALGDWVMAYIKALEENEHFDILIEVSIDNLGPLFLAMNNPLTLRQSVANVIFHILASLREFSEAVDSISTHLGQVLESLAADSGPWSRQLLQNIVDILTTTMDTLVESLKGDAQDLFKDKYADVILCLERHMASGGCGYLQLNPWRTRNNCAPAVTTHAPMRKVGLLNLGNTCYVNSVIQALLVTRQFSTHTILRMTSAPYWSLLGIFFAKMIHSISTKLDPQEIYSVVKPPFFTRNNQHDSSEFLGYLFELLQSYEHVSDRNFDYTRTPVLTGSSRMRVYHAAHGNTSPAHSSSDGDHGDTASNVHGRSMSPRPGSSAAGSSSSSLKRPSTEHEVHGPPKKRLRMYESAFLRRDSFVDNMFGGVLLIRVECTECHFSSHSRDVFRDLQLSFPEKSEVSQHTVQTLLEYYCSKERLSNDNRYECPHCGGLRDAERSVIIETIPKYLILVLKNFKFEPKVQVQRKLMLSMYYNHTVTLPTVRTQSNHSNYSLYAAVIHTGTTLDSGHYYTMAKDNDQWHIYNDDQVSSANEGQLNELNRSSTPYILFYRRSDIDEGCAPTLEELPPKIQESVAAHNKHYVDTVRKMRLTRP